MTKRSGLKLTPGEVQRIVSRLEEGGSVKEESHRLGFRNPDTLRDLLRHLLGSRFAAVMHRSRSVGASMRRRGRHRERRRRGPKGLIRLESLTRRPPLRTTLEATPREVRVDPAEIELPGGRTLRIARLAGDITLTYGTQLARAASTATQPSATVRIPRTALPEVLRRLQQTPSCAR